eukprot:maker-scaffold503_size153465-snap-gene-0.15 protein:Tk08622 transcript:maker-scaffold503_size153465-snap-gene-0.15-mRNA-1 annotation:"hypothetical protein DAPPUDRAFT_305430"
MERYFAGKRILITGVGQGIGRCTAVSLHAMGAEVHGISLTQKNLDSLREECPNIKTYCQDISQWDNLKRLLESLPVMDGVVNNAAINILEPILEVQESHLDKVLNTNVKAVLNISQTMGRKMIEAQRSGAFVNVSSQASLVALEDHVAYAASKAAVDQITRLMALEFGKHNIRSNCVNPTVALTELGKLKWNDPAVAEPMKKKIPLQRFAEPQEIADVIIFLLSDKASMVNGIIMPIDGGYTAC